MRFHDGPFINASPSDIGGLTIVIGFLFIALGFLLPDECRPYLIGILVPVEIAVIIRWFYAEQQEAKQSLSIFQNDENANDPSPQGRFPTLTTLMPILQRFVIALAVFLLVGPFTILFLAYAYVPALHWVVLWLLALAIVLYIALRVIRSDKPDEE